MSEIISKIIIALSSSIITFIAGRVWDRIQNKIRYIEYIVRKTKNGLLQVCIYNRTQKDYTNVEIDIYFRHKTNATKEVKTLSYRIDDSLGIVQPPPKKNSKSKQSTPEPISRLGLTAKVLNRNGENVLLSIFFTLEQLDGIECVVNVIKEGIFSRRIDHTALLPVRKTIKASEAATAGIALFVGLYALMSIQEPKKIADTKNHIDLIPGKHIAHIPDKSMIWINRGSVLQVGQEFGLRSRDVTLSGEAYFDVRHGDHAFVIHTRNEKTIRVLGSSFFEESALKYYQPYTYSQSSSRENAFNKSVSPLTPSYSPLWFPQNNLPWHQRHREFILPESVKRKGRNRGRRRRSTTGRNRIQRKRGIKTDQNRQISAS